MKKDQAIGASKSAQGAKGKQTDSITGLYLQIPGAPAPFKTDQVYTINPGDINSLSVDSATTVEFELGTEYIAWTATADTGTTRVVAKGSFSYSKKGRLTKASITDLAQDWPGVPSLGGVISKYKSGGLQSSNTIDFAGLQNSDNWIPTDSYMSEPHQYPGGAAAVLSGTINGIEIWTTGLGKEAITSFGGGKFFYSGWEANPFASNLI